MSSGSPTRVVIGLLATLAAVSGCGDDGDGPSRLHIVETKGEGPGKPARPPAPPDEGELPDTEAPTAPTAEAICASDLRIPSIAALEAEWSLTKLVLDGVGHYRLQRDTAWYDEWSLGTELTLEGHVSPDRIKALWCEALQHWRRLVPRPDHCSYLFDSGTEVLRIRGPEEVRSVEIHEIASCPERNAANEFTGRLWHGFAQVRQHEITVRRLVRAIGRQCGVSEREGVAIAIRASDASLEHLETSGVSRTERQCIAALVDANVLWEATAPTFDDATLTELEVKIELHPRQPDRPPRGADGFLQTWSLPGGGPSRPDPDLPPAEPLPLANP